MVCRGEAILLTGTFSAACMNTLAKRLYHDGSVSQMSLFAVRSVAVYALNGLVVAAQSGGEGAVWVLTLRVDNARQARLAAWRGVAGTMGVCLIHISFQLMNLADAIAVSLAFEMLTTVATARLCVSSERLTGRTLVGGAMAMLGVVLVTRPAALFGGGAPPSASGSLAAVAGGVSLGHFNVLSRVLGRASSSAGGDEPPLSPATLTAYYMVALGLASAAVQCAAAAAGAAAPSWAAPALHLDAPLSAAMMAGYCALVLVFQLSIAAAYGRMQAGRAAILSLTEIGFTWLLGVGALGETSDLLASVGIVAIFAGSALSTWADRASDETQGGSTDAEKRRGRTDPGGVLI